MFGFPKIWHALFSCYLRLEMRLSTLLLTTCSFNGGRLKAMKNGCKFFRRGIFSGMESKILQENMWFGLFLRILAGSGSFSVLLCSSHRVLVFL